MLIPPGATSQSITVQIVDDTGLAVTGLVAGTWPATSYARVAEAAVSITLGDLVAITSAYASGGVKEVGSGYYRLDVPDAAFATASKVRIVAEATGKHIVYPPIDVAKVAATMGATDYSGNTVQTGDAFARLPADPAGLASLASAHGAGPWATATGFAVAGDAMGLVNGAITDAKITFPGEAAGRPTTALAVLRRVWEWVANKRTRDRSTGTLLLRNAADDGTLETQTQSTASTTDTVTKGA